MKNSLIYPLRSIESALARPFQTFSGKEIYPTIFEKAAALGESIIKNHPFADGNRHVGHDKFINQTINISLKPRQRISTAL